MNDPKSRDQGSYFSAPDLIGPLESAYCFAHKFMWLNGVGSGAIARLFGFRLRDHSLPSAFEKSFLSDWWVKERSYSSPFAGAVPRTKELRSMFLSALCGPWSEIIGAVDLRFCSMCLKHGFHSSIFQVAALGSCPLHGCALTASCVSCGDAMSAYVLSHRTFKSVCGCTNCKFDWAPERIWTWFDVQNFHAAFQSASTGVVAWLEALREIPLPFGHAEGQQPLSYIGVSLNDRAYFCARAAVGPCPLERPTRSDRVWTACIEKRFDGQLGADCPAADLVGLSRAYRAVRRHIEKCFFTKHRHWIRFFRSVSLVTETMEPCPGGEFPLVVAAYASWRSNIEAVGGSKRPGPFFSATLIVELQLSQLSFKEIVHLLLGYFFGLCAIASRARMVKDEARIFLETSTSGSDRGMSTYAAYQFRVLDGFRREVIPFAKLQLSPPTHHLRVRCTPAAPESSIYILPSRELGKLVGCISSAESRRMLKKFHDS